MLKKLKLSFLELKNIKTITTCAILMAISSILGIYTINIANIVKINFSFIGTSLAGFLFGPIVGALFGGILNIINHFITPTGSYFFGFTLNIILNGFIYGMFYYKSPKKYNFSTIFLANLSVSLLTSIGLGTYWLSILYGKSFFSFLPARILAAIVTTPLYSFIFYQILKLLKKYFYLNNKIGD